MRVEAARGDLQGDKGTFLGNPEPFPPTRKGPLVHEVPSVPSFNGHISGRGPLVQPFSEEALQRLAKKWGAGEDGYFPCPLPGHDGRALLVSDDRGDAALGCCTGRTRSLAEVRAAEAYGDTRLRSNIELATWRRRLAWELGEMQPIEVELPPCPEGAPAPAHTMRQGFALLVGLRRVDYEPRPVAYSIRFAAAWCGLSHGSAATGLRILREAGVIREAGRAGRVPLYLPGGEA